MEGTTPAATELVERELTFVAADPPRRSWFAAWDPDNPGGLGDDTDATTTLVLRAKRGTRRTEVAARRIEIADAIDLLAPLSVDDPASASAHGWASVMRAALSFIAGGKVLPWVSPEGWDSWRVDPLDATDHELVVALAEALPAAAHAAPGPARATMADPAWTIRTACDAIADAFIRTPAAHRIGGLRLFADADPTRVPHLRPWVGDLAAEHCSSSRLVLHMHPPERSGAAPDDSIDSTPGPDAPLVVLAAADPADGAHPDADLAEVLAFPGSGARLTDDPDGEAPAAAAGAEVVSLADHRSADEVADTDGHADRVAATGADDHTVHADLGDVFDIAELDIAEATEDPGLYSWRVTFALQSRVDPSLVIDAERFWHAPTEVMERLGAQAETTLLAGLRTVTTLVEPLADILDDVAPTEATIAPDRLDHLLDALDDLDDAGIEVRWPSALVAPRIDARLTVSTAAPGGDLATGFTLDSVLDVDWEFLLDGTPLTAEELSVLADAKRSVIPLRGRWVRLDQATRERLARPVPDVSIAGALAAALAAADEAEAAEPASPEGASDADAETEATIVVDDEHIAVRLFGTLGTLVERLGEVAGARQADEPAGLHAELRHYQKRGLAWLADLTQLGFGGCLADDMGLGKTIQILALHAERGGPTLIICPTSLMNNWAREAARFVPDASVHLHHGANRQLPEPGPGDLVITTYGIARADADQLAEIEWDLVVADEAQHVKNPRSRTARAIRTIPHGVRIALTGTPVENNLSELWSIMDWAVPGLLGPLETFRRTMALPIERDRDPAATGRLRALVRPFLLRRTKRDPGIAPELPDKIERDVVVPLTDEQITLYKATTDQALLNIASAEGIDRRGLILKLLTALKQITNHPAHFLGQTDPLDGRSGKLAALDELLDRTTAGDEATLVFTQYVAMGRLIADHQRRAGRRVEMLHGSLSVKARQELVDRFQAGELDLLVLSLKAGGTGLNLTAATHVIHYDRWWNPAVEDQATDRAYRIGQTETVTVHRLVTQGTVEDRVNDLLTAKRHLADAITSAGESWIGDLDDDDLADLVSLAVT